MIKMAIKCSGGNCGISCNTDACSCTYSPTDPDICACDCIQSQPALTKSVKKISIVKFKRQIKANPQSRYNICLRNVPITTLALSFDEILPNRILIPTNKLTKKVNLTLKNKTFRQIVISTGLKLKS
ncbi:MAG TPA: hypothetical protein VFM20_00690 [Nitrososphaeraceae archaeon]|jgi:hypothetical protein|nr:hypothetical protein [Nitrososphaeraceae archaeon]